MLEILTILLIVLNCIAIGAAIGHAVFKVMQLRDAEDILKRFEATAKAASDASNSQAKKIIELNDKINALSMKSSKLSAM
jgi:hypothetical protein